MTPSRSGAHNTQVEEVAPAITDPASVLIGLGAVVALFAAIYWISFAKVSALVAEPTGWKARRNLGFAATMTGVALALVAGGYLFGRVTGRF